MEKKHNKKNKKISTNSKVSGAGIMNGLRKGRSRGDDMSKSACEVNVDRLLPLYAHAGSPRICWNSGWRGVPSMLDAANRK